MTIQDFLMTYTRKTIVLDTLEKTFFSVSPALFVQQIRELENTHILKGIKSQGMYANGLYRKYTINAHALYAPIIEKIQSDALALHISGSLDISWYYTKPLAYWQQDCQDIQKLDTYLKTHFSIPPASLQQRSYDIFGDEKLLTKQGISLLSRVQITLASLHIIDEYDPLMLAFHPMPNTSTSLYHFIVENKAPYFRLLPQLSQTHWTSLILGYGWKIVGNLCLLPQQCGWPQAHHICWYFGDFDWEGLRIWHALAEQSSPITVRLAVPFYRKFLTHTPSKGKENQQPAPSVFNDFLQHFSLDEQKQFRRILQTGCYYPQETLTVQDMLPCIKELTYET